jgi:hypothetical protein
MASNTRRLAGARGGQAAAAAGLSAAGSLTVRKGGVVEIAGAPSCVEQDLVNQGEIAVSGCNLDIKHTLQLEGELRLVNASSISSNLAYAGTIPLEESKIESRGPLDAQGSCYLNFTAGSNSCAWAGIADKPWPETAQVVVSGWNEKNKIRAGQGGTALSEAQLDRFAFTSVRGEDRNAKLIKGGWMVPVMNKPLSPPFGIICQPEQQNVVFGGPHYPGRKHLEARSRDLSMAQRCKSHTRRHRLGLPHPGDYGI